MNRTLTYALAAITLLGVGLVSYRVGALAGQAQAKEAFGLVLASVQADLGLSKLQRLRELEGDLARGCSTQALAKLRFDIDTQMYVLASFYRDHKGTWVIDDLTKRDPAIASQLEGFKQQFSSWKEPKCPG